MRKLPFCFSFLTLALAGLFSSCVQETPPPNPATTPPSYVVMETNSSRILYSSNAGMKRPIGMLANIATAAVALDWAKARHISMNQMLPVPETVLQWNSTNLLHLRPGDSISLRDALHSTLMWDDSAAAATLARACGLSLSSSNPDSAFISQMNQLAHKLGMNSTFFKGTNGAVITQSTARDMALLGMYALQDATIQGIASKRSCVATIHSASGTRTRTITNSNSALSASKSVDGLRAARSRTAGACLIATSKRASVKRLNPRTGQMSTYGQRLLVVILGMPSSRQRYNAASRFLHDGWGEWERWMKTYDLSDPTKFIILPN